MTHPLLKDSDKETRRMQCMLIPTVAKTKSTKVQVYTAALKPDLIIHLISLQYIFDTPLWSALQVQLCSADSKPKWTDMNIVSLGVTKLQCRDFSHDRAPLWWSTCAVPTCCFVVVWIFVWILQKETFSAPPVLFTLYVHECVRACVCA